MGARGSSALKVGVVILVALVLLVTGILLIGEQNQLFARKNDYFIQFADVGGLNTGSPVQLNGVDVGSVMSVKLPEDPEAADIRVEISIDRRYAARVRADSQAAIKTLGLLGDKYVEISSGSPEEEPIPDGGQIPTAATTSIDELLAGGENMMDNVIAISFSLRNILARMEAGEGILGRLTTDNQESTDFLTSIQQILDSVETIADQIENGDGPLPRLLNDEQLGNRMASSIERLDRVMENVEEGDGALPALLNDAETADQVREAIANLNQASKDLSRFISEVESSDGLLQRMLTDEEYGEEVSGQVRDLVERIDKVTRQVTEGDGTVAQLLEDPEVYQALKDILVGINDSRILRWLIQNRQKKGIELRYEEGVGEGEVAPVPPRSEFPSEPPAGEGDEAGSAAPGGGAAPGGLGAGR